MPKKKSKAEKASLTQELNRIHDAWRAFRASTVEAVDDSWIIEVFDNEIIIDQNGTFFKVGFTEEDEEITFADRSEWVEVEREVEFVEKSARAFVRQTGKNPLKTIHKTEEEITVANYIVMFGDPETRDLEHEYFSEKTNLESSYTKTGFLHVDWDHGLGKEIYDGVGPGKNDILGIVKWESAKVDEMGVWVERVLNLRNSYMEYIEPLISAGMVGTSSKAIKEGVKVTKDGFIEIWPLERDTLTVIPAEPRMMTENVIHALKSLVAEFPKLQALLPQEPGIGSSANVKPKEAPKAIKNYLEVKQSMKTKKELLALYAEKMGLEVEDLNDKHKAAALDGTTFAVVDDPKDDPIYVTAAELSPMQEQIKSMSESLNEVLRYAKDTPAIDNAGYISRTGGSSDKSLVSLGDFLQAVGRDDRERLKTIYKSFWEDGEKTDMSHVDGIGGGFLLPTEFSGPLLKIAEDMSPLQNMVTKTPVSTNRGQMPSLNQFDAPTAGVGNTAFAGGVTAAATAENTTLTETRPTFKLIEWNIHKQGGVTQAPNELINDSPESIETILSALFVIAINSKVEYQILRGTGANENLGILNSDALVSVTTTSDNTFALKDAANMLSRFLPQLSNGAFFMHPGVIPDLTAFEAGTGGSVWLMDQKNDPMIGQPILGKPVFMSQHLPQDDNSGDVILADMKSYLLFMNQGLQIAFSPHVAFKEDQGTWRFTQRMDGQPWLNSAITLADPQGSYTVSPFVKHND